MQVEKKECLCQEAGIQTHTNRSKLTDTGQGLLSAPGLLGADSELNNDNIEIRVWYWWFFMNNTSSGTW